MPAKITIRNNGPVRIEGERRTQHGEGKARVVPDARQGIAVFDHPANPGFPGLFGKTAVLSQITLICDTYQFQETSAPRN